MLGLIGAIFASPLVDLAVIVIIFIVVILVNLKKK